MSVSRLVFILLFFCSVGLTSTRASAQVGVNLFGLSHHFGDAYREEPHSFNPGLGLHWTFDRGRRTALEFNVGVYLDSFQNLNRHVSLGGRFKLWGPLEMGVNVLMARSSSINNDRTLIYPLPFLSFRQPGFVLNTIFIPELGGEQSLPTIGLTATIFPFHDGFAWDDPRYRNTQRRSYLEFKVFGLALLDGEQGIGFLWRRMFNSQNGIRLGFDMNGWIGLGDNRGHSAYEISILAQYLHRFAANKKSGIFVASGMRVDFTDGAYGNNTRYEILLNLGWEYSLNNSISLYTETGLRLSYENYDPLTGEGNPEPWESSDKSLQTDGITFGVAVGL